MSSSYAFKMLNIYKILAFSQEREKMHIVLFLMGCSWLFCFCISNIYLYDFFGVYCFAIINEKIPKYIIMKLVVYFGSICLASQTEGLLH